MLLGQFPLAAAEIAQAKERATFAGFLSRLRTVSQETHQAFPPSAALGCRAPGRDEVLRRLRRPGCAWVGRSHSGQLPRERIRDPEHRALELRDHRGGLPDALGDHQRPDGSRARVLCRQQARRTARAAVDHKVRPARVRRRRGPSARVPLPELRPPGPRAHHGDSRAPEPLLAAVPAPRVDTRPLHLELPPSATCRRTAVGPTPMSSRPRRSSS